MSKIIKFVLMSMLLIFVFIIANFQLVNPQIQIIQQDSINTETNRNFKSTIYYVSISGSDSNDGQSIENPFKTISRAAEAASAGDKILIRNGTYKESIELLESGTQNSPIIFKNYNDEVPVIDGTGLNSNVGLSISSKSYITIDGLTIQNFTSDNKNVVMGISIDGNSKGIKILNCEIHDINTTYAPNDFDRNAHGIAVYGNIPKENAAIEDLIIDNNQVYDCRLGQSEAVVLNGNVSNFKVTNNKIYNNDNIGIDFIGFEGTANKNKAGDSSSEIDRARNGICSGNEIWNISSAKNPTYKGAGLCAAGIYVDGACNITIEKNKIDKCDIGVEAASEHYGCSAENIIIRNNLIANCKGVGGISFGGASAKENGTAENIKIINNTLYNNNPNINIQNASSKTNQICNNICYRGAFSEGNKGENKISNNLTENPGFINTTTWNFNLKPESPAIDAGISSDYGRTDMSGKSRVKGKAVDYGAFEYQD